MTSGLASRSRNRTPSATRPAAAAEIASFPISFRSTRSFRLTPRTRPNLTAITLRSITPTRTTAEIERSVMAVRFDYADQDHGRNRAHHAKTGGPKPETGGQQHA